MFSIGDFVVYGRTGICEIVDITTMKMEGVPQDKLYYILMPCNNKAGKIFTPVENGKVIIRSVISREEALALLDRISEISELSIPSEKMRESLYKECIRSCECEEFVRLIKTLHIRREERIAQGKKITATDDRYLKMAEAGLYSELSLVLERSESDLQALIMNVLKNVS